MSPQEVKNYFGSGYKFNKLTGMSASTYLNWFRSGRVPIESQVKLHKLTKGTLKAELGIDNE